MDEITCWAAFVGPFSDVRISTLLCAAIDDLNCSWVLATVHSRNLADCADIAVFLTCCCLSFEIRSRVGLSSQNGHSNSQGANSQGANVQGANVQGANNPDANHLPWVQATLLLIGLAHALKVSIIPDSLQSYSMVAKLVSAAAAIVGYLKFISPNRPHYTSTTSPSAEIVLQQRANQLAVTQRRLDTVERNLELVLEAGQVGLWEWHPKDNTFSISSSFRKLLNLPSDSVWNTLEHWQQYLAEEDREKAVSDFQRFAAGEIPGYEATYRMTTADDQTAWILCRSESIKNSDGQIVGAHGIARDVTMPRRLRQQLRIHQHVLFMSQEAVLFVQPNGRICQANHAATKMLHATEDQLCDLTIFDIDSSQSPKKWKRHWASLQNGEPFRAATNYLRRNNRPLNCEVQQKLVMAEGEPILVISAIDISSRKSRESQQRRHEFATDRATESVYWVRENGQLVYANQAVCRQTGYSQAELLKMKVGDLNPALTAEAWADQWNQIRQHGFVTAEAVQKSRNGDSIQVSTNLYFYDVEGEQLVVATSRNITAQKLADAALSAKSAEMEQLLKSLPMGFVFVNRERKVLQVNAEFSRMFGYSQSEIEGQSSEILYASFDDFKQAGEYQKLLRQEPEPRRFVVKFRRKDGSILRAQTYGVVLRNEQAEVCGYLGLIKDFTAQWEVERTLRRTQAALDTAADAVLWIQQDGRILYANQVACQRLQYSKIELEQLTVADINPDVRATSGFTTDFWPVIKHKGQIKIEMRHQRRDGSVFPVEIVSHFQHFEGSEFTCSFIRDISDRVAAQQQLFEAQAKLELAVQSGNVSLWEWDWNTGAIQVSPEYHRSLGEIPGTITTVQEWRKRLHPDDAQQELEIARKLRQSVSAVYDRTYRIRHKDGSYRWVLSRGRLSRRPDGNPHRLVGCLVDITALRHAQLRTEAYVKLVGTTDGSWDWDVECDAVVYSPRFFELIGFSEADFTDIPGTISFLKQQMHADDRDLFWQKIDEHFCSSEFFDHEVRLQMRNETYRWFRFRAQTIFDSEERPVRMAGSIYDVTHQKEVELQLRRSNDDLQQFAYVASHDLQEPLRAVSGFCRMLELKYNDKLDDDGRLYIQYAIDGASRMQRLIEDLLNYSRIGRKDGTQEVASLKTCATQAVTELQAIIDQTKAKITIEDLPDVPCNPGLMLRLFQNLISNAIKFGRENVPVEVTVRTDHIEDDPDGNIVLHVIDNGIGIEPKFQRQIFDLFQRLHYRDTIPGTGLGLAICQRIAERHNGKITVTSVVGKGSTFVITLPKKART